MGQFSSVDPGSCGCDSAAADARQQCCCVVRDLTHVIGRKYAMAIVNRIGNRPARFLDLQRELEVGPSTLADTLRELQQVGLIRRGLADSASGSEYFLTPAGAALRARLRHFLDTLRRLK